MHESADVSNEDVRERVEEAATGERDQVRVRIRKLVEDLARGNEKVSTGVSNIAREVYGAAADVVHRSVPDDPDSVLREVIDGIGDGVQKAAQATRYAVEEATSRGETFAREDLDRMGRDFESLGNMFVDMVSETASRTGGEVSRALRDATTHAERMVRSIRPSVDDAVRALRRDPVRATTDAASAAVDGTRRAAGSIFSVMAGLLEGTADALDPDRGRKEKRSSDDRA